MSVNRHDPPCSFVLPPGEKGKLWPSTARSRTARPTTLECAPHSSRTVHGCACVASSRRYGAWQESTARRARPASASIFVGGDPSQRFNGCERRADARCAHSHGARAPRARRFCSSCLRELVRADRPSLLSCAQGPPIMTEAVDKWVFDTFRQLFPPCGPGTPHQKKMLCGCDPTNPEHYVRLLEVDDALKAKDRDDGTVFTKGLSPSKIGAILARFGVQHKQSGINQDTCKARGFRHNSVPSGSALFGRKPIQGGACSGAASAAGAATAAASAVGSGATNPGGAANPGVAAALASGNGGAAPPLAWAPVISLASGLAVQSAPSVAPAAPAAESTVRAA